jgi:hypothetical protein
MRGASHIELILLLSVQCPSLKPIRHSLKGSLENSETATNSTMFVSNTFSFVFVPFHLIRLVATVRITENTMIVKRPKYYRKGTSKTKTTKAYKTKRSWKRGK